MKHRFKDLMDMDEELFQLASYEASEGLIPILSTPEEVDALKQKVSKIFNEYKLGIQRGSFDLHYIKNRVSKYGSILSKYKNNEEQYDAILNGEDTDIIENDEKLYTDMLTKYLQATKDLKTMGEQGVESLGGMLKEFIASETEDKEEVLPLYELDEYDKYKEFYDDLEDTPDDLDDDFDKDNEDNEDGEVE